MSTRNNPGNDFKGPVYRDGLSLLLRSTANTGLALGSAVAADNADGVTNDHNVTDLGGVIPCGCGDAIYFSFAQSGTVTAPTFLITRFNPVEGKDGTIIGYSESALCDITSSLTTGTKTIGTAFASVVTSMGATPVTAPAGTETWYKTITCNVNTVAVSGSVVLNNMDVLSSAVDGPAILRLTPADGDSHYRIQTATGGGGGAVLVFARRGRGLSLNVP